MSKISLFLFIVCSYYCTVLLLVGLCFTSFSEVFSWQKTKNEGSRLQDRHRDDPRLGSVVPGGGPEVPAGYVRRAVPAHPRNARRLAMLPGCGADDYGAGCSGEGGPE